MAISSSSTTPVVAASSSSASNPRPSSSSSSSNPTPASSSSSSSNPTPASSSSSSSNPTPASSSSSSSNPSPSSSGYPILSIDWYNKGVLTPIRDQGSCGGCYAFSTIASIESAYLIRNKLNYWSINLSIQQIIDCSSAYGNYGCEGGWYQASFSYVKDKGLAT